MYHVCSAQASPVKNSFLCNNGSIFNQERFVCDWWSNVDCPNSERSFDLNLEIGKTPNKPQDGASASSSAASNSNLAAGAGAKLAGAGASQSYPSSAPSSRPKFGAGASQGYPSSAPSSGSKFGAGASQGYPSSAPSSGPKFGAGASQGFPSSALSSDLMDDISSSGSSAPGSDSAFGSKGTSSGFAASASSSNSIGSDGDGSSSLADEENSLAASLSKDVSIGSPAAAEDDASSSSVSSEDSLAASLADNSVIGSRGDGSATASAAAGGAVKTDTMALSYPGPSAGFSPDIATGGIDLRVGGEGDAAGPLSLPSKGPRRLSPAATSSLRESFAKSSARAAADKETVETAATSYAVAAPVRYGERLASSSRVAAPALPAGAAQAAPAKELEAPTYKRKRLVARRRRVTLHEATHGARAEA